MWIKIEAGADVARTLEMYLYNYCKLAGIHTSRRAAAHEKKHM